MMSDVASIDGRGGFVYLFSELVFCGARDGVNKGLLLFWVFFSQKIFFSLLVKATFVCLYGTLYF